MTSLAGSPLLYGSADGTGAAARFISPTALAVDARGNVYVADGRAAVVRRIAPNGTVTIAAGVPLNIGIVDGAAGGARLASPQGLAVTPAGTLYIADGSTIRSAVPNFASGDVNGDTAVTVGDIFYLVNNLFASGAAPIGPADANGDGQVTVGDIFYLVNHLFASGPAPL